MKKFALPFENGIPPDLMLSGDPAAMDENEKQKTKLWLQQNLARYIPISPQNKGKTQLESSAYSRSELPCPPNHSRKHGLKPWFSNPSKWTPLNFADT